MPINVHMLNQFYKGINFFMTICSLMSSALKFNLLPREVIYGCLSLRINFITPPCGRFLRFFVILRIFGIEYCRSRRTVYQRQNISKVNNGSGNYNPCSEFYCNDNKTFSDENDNSRLRKDGIDGYSLSSLSKT